MKKTQKKTEKKGKNDKENIEKYPLDKDEVQQNYKIKR